VENGNLVPLKVVVRGIQTKEAIDFVGEYVKQLFDKHLVKKLRSKSAPESLFEVYYLLLSLSDTLTTAMIDKKAVKRAVNLCRKGIALYPVTAFELTADGSCNAF
jgi:hypothetical protein